MRKTITLIIFTLIYGSCAPRISTTELKTDFKNYNAYVSNGNYEKVIGYMPTDFWNVYEKDKFLTRIKEIGNQFDSISINNVQIKNVSKSIKSDNKYFRVITYSTDLVFDFSNISDKALKSYETKFGADKIKLDTINNLLKIENNSQMIAVYDHNLEQWKYLEFASPSIEKIYGFETWNKLIKYVR